ncbi:ATP-binding cassette sub-family A member 3-like isoform X5 [Hermetia illucens]|uniref:ATP-binding cassette sub-family A member 3-like isoform X5 n=1 Tax=Hermetia illucens TaxID=343691 RepID=UPI0018CC64A5|nr:ATP-binding cassette sub-family A member 3-like isoform X5 [Hermetia illucens]
MYAWVDEGNLFKNRARARSSSLGNIYEYRSSKKRNVYQSSGLYTTNYSPDIKVKDDEMASNFFAYTNLLIWKNFKIRFRHKKELVAELLVPIIFCLILLLIRYVSKPEIIKDPTTFEPVPLSTFKPLYSDQSYNYTLLAYAPQSIQNDKIMVDAAATLGMQIKGFENDKAMETFMAVNHIFCGIRFNTNANQTSKKFDFTLRPQPNFPNIEADSKVGWNTASLFREKTLPGPIDGEMLPQVGGRFSYLTFGLTSIQYAISNSYIKLTAKEVGTKTDAILPDIKMQRFPYPPYVSDATLVILNILLALIFLLCFVYPVSQTTKHVTGEKEKQLTETMKIMGLRTAHHWTSWFTTTFVLRLIVIVIIVILIKSPICNETGVLPASSGVVLFLFLLCYSASMITFSFLISAFFNKSSVASSVASAVWFLFYIPSTLTLGKYFTSIKWLSSALCLFMNTSMTLGVKSIIMWETKIDGVQFYNIMSSPGGKDTLSVGFTMIMLLVDAILYMLLTIYVEKVFPGEYGFKEPWYFCFKVDYWLPKRTQWETLHDEASLNNYDDPDRFENDPATVNKKAGVQIRNLRKTFGDKIAVAGLSLDMYENEITVLLGHNGAGKTTTISMITGFLMPTRGTIRVNNLDTSTHMSEVRKTLGVCPQHNILFDTLTVQEHIIFYGRLKGLRPSQISAEIDKYLQILQLEDKRHEQSQNLSGGMKRKLSLVVALCGGSKVVLCDEPSSGMDPEARRALWNLLETEKNGRTILLTTHFMDEADVLGDRIAIMSGGTLACSGTPFFLKKKFGTGYQLICNRNPTCDEDKVTALIRKYIPDALIKSNVGTELSYSLPEIYVPQFEPMLSELEASQERLGLSGYGISMTTLEDVFMKTGSEVHKSDTMYGTVDNSPEVALDYGNDLVADRKRCCYQWRAMFYKKIICMQRSWIICLIQVLFPLLMLILIAKDKVFDSKPDLPPLKISLDNYGRTYTLLANPENSKLGTAYETLFSKKHQLVRTSKSMMDALNDLDRKTTTFSKASNYLAAATTTDTEGTAWFNHEAMHTIPLSLNLIQNAVARKILGDTTDIQVSVHPLPYVLGQKPDEELGFFKGFQFASSFAFTIPIVSALFVMFVVKERVSKCKHLQSLGGVKPLSYWLSHLTLDMSLYLLIAIGVVVVCAIFQVENFSSSESLALLFMVFILYGLSSLSFTYLISFTVKSPADGLSRCFLINIIAGLGFLILNVILPMVLSETRPKTVKFVRLLCLLFPSYGLSDAINGQGTYYFWKSQCKNIESAIIFGGIDCDTGIFGWDFPGLGAPVTFLIVTALVYFLALLAVDTYIGYLHNVKNICRPKFPSSSSEVDDDVQAEKYRVANMTPDEIKDHVLVMARLTKFYRRFLAVNNLSVAVEHGDCFGLLGVNGAGKTSAFKMLTGDENISYGKVWIEGYNIQSEMNSVKDKIGYCPQFDALLFEMTGFELLKMFCLIHGIPKEIIPRLIERLARDLAFEECLYRRTEGYSGGNKRKLSAAIALLGDPHIIYMDEPTSGIDPASRRKLWDMICLIRNSGKGIILTSHSMEECEALCTRVAIMVNGEFKCLGSTQHLKNKFSKGISLSIKLRKLEQSHGMNVDDEMSRREGIVTNFISKNFPGAVLKESRLRLLTFEIPLGVMPYSRIFGLMERNRDNLNMEDYSLTQATLEQIFIQFAQQQRTSDEDNKKKKNN